MEHGRQGLGLPVFSEDGARHGCHGEGRPWKAESRIILALKDLGGDGLLRTVGCLLLSSGPSLDPPCSGKERVFKEKLKVVFQKNNTNSKACLMIKHWGPTTKKPDKTLCLHSYRNTILEPSTEEFGVT